MVLRYLTVLQSTVRSGRGVGERGAEQPLGGFDGDLLALGVALDLVELEAADREIVDRSPSIPSADLGGKTSNEIDSVIRWPSGPVRSGYVRISTYMQ